MSWKLTGSVEVAVACQLDGGDRDEEKTRWSMGEVD
jgi:hypothetical protein